MPNSRKRKLTYGQRVKGALRRARIYTENKAKVLRILEAAMPYKQQYPPTIKHSESKRLPKEIVAQPTYKVGQIVTLSDRKYQVQRDGSWRRVRPRASSGDAAAKAA